MSPSSKENIVRNLMSSSSKENIVRNLMSSSSKENTVELHLPGRWLSGSPIMRIRLNQVKFVENSTNLTFVNNSRRTSDPQSSIFSYKNQIIRIFC
jgi:hypothetical protein